MRVPNRRLQVFVSSTFTDLRQERQAAVAAILDAGHIPAGMELFGADNAEQMEVIREWIEESDVFILLLAGRYGSLESESRKSYTELEYEHALSLGKPVLSMVMTDETIAAREKDHPDLIERKYGEQLGAFRARVLNNKKMADFFSSTDSLTGKVGRALRTVERDESLVGWVRRTDAVNATTALNQIMALTEETKTLRAQLESARAAGAGTSPFIPPLATRSLSIPCIDGSGEVVSCETNYFDWFLFCGKRLGSKVTVDEFISITQKYFRSLEISRHRNDLQPLVPEDVAQAALREFTLFGWIHNPELSSESAIGLGIDLLRYGQRPVTLTPEGRSLFLRHARQ